MTSIIFPPMQERASFKNRYHTEAVLNEQSWRYLDAETIWDLPFFIKRMKSARHPVLLFSQACIKILPARRLGVSQAEQQHVHLHI